MQILYPEIKPYAVHQLQVDATHKLYIEESGCKTGFPILVIHGGPGSGSSSFQRRFFDPERFRIILFDQRGCGKSEPYGSLVDNTTAHLIADIEAIRQHLAIDKWLLFGGSWGATLALLYAQAHPDMVIGMLLRGVFLNRQQDLNWLYRDGANHIFPDAWQAFTEAVHEDIQDGILHAFAKRLEGDNELVRMSAAKAWVQWESSISTLKTNPKMVEHMNEPHIAVSMAKISVHYFKHNSFIYDQQILLNMDKIQHIPGTIVHGRYDMVCPLENATSLHKAWPNAELNIIREAGHASTEPGTVDALVKASTDMADFLSYENKD